MPFIPIDLIEAHEPWSYMRASKTVGVGDCRPSPASGVGHLAESQIMDAVFWIGRLLVLTSTRFQKNGAVTGVHDFSFGTMPQPKETIQVKVNVVRHDWDDIVLQADVSSHNHFIARGSFTLEEVELNDENELDRLRTLWSSISRDVNG